MRARLVLLAALAVLSSPGAAMAQEHPLVIDEASALAEGTRQELSDTLARIETSTGVRGRLVVVRDLGGKTASAAAMAYIDTGSQEQAVLLMAMREREVRIQTTPGLQARIPDQTWSGMISSEMIPELRRVRQASAARRGVEAMGDVLANQYEPSRLGTVGDFGALRDVGVVALVAFLLALGLYPRSRARIIGRTTSL